MKKLLVFYLFCFALFGCCSDPVHPSNYHYQPTPDPHANTLYVDVYIDKDFNDQQRFVIEESLGVWNIAWNHYFEYKMINERVAVDQNVIDKVRHDHGLIFVQMENLDADDGTLARVDAIDGHVIFVNTNRNSVNLTVLLHEEGHAAPNGLTHHDIKQSLMYPFYVEQPNGQCIDSATIDQLVEKKYWLKKQYLNWCKVN